MPDPGHETRRAPMQRTPAVGARLWPMTSVIEPAPTPEEWERRLRIEPAEELPKLHSHANGLLAVNHAGWAPLVAIAERVMAERGIEF
jgi:hypothetical protein